MAKLFMLNGKPYIDDGSGNLIPYVEEVKKEESLKIAFSPNEVTKILGLSRCSVISLLVSGQLQSIKAGRKWIVPLWAIEELLKVPK